MKIIDLTHTYENGMTGMSEWHPIVEFKRLAKLEEVEMNTSSIMLGSHIGTHMDAPSHHFSDGYAIEAIPLEYCIGNVTIVDVRHRGKGDYLHVSDLEPYSLNERVILCFGYAKYWNTPEEYNNDYPYISMEAAQYLLDHNVKLVGMDIPSPDCKPQPGEKKYPVHKLMLKNDVIFVESLANIDAIDFKADYTFIVLPLKLNGVDASPCRAILIEHEKER